MDNRESPINISKAEFQQMGHELVDAIAEFLDAIHLKPVTTGESPKEIQSIMNNSPLPEIGKSAGEVLSGATKLLMEHSLLNGHPKFFGYITSSPAPIGALADMLAAAVNPNVGAQVLSPVATEIEKQTVKWLASFIGVSTTYGGLLVSGGNMANFTAFLAARTAKAPATLKEGGLASVGKRMMIYCSTATHTWIEKAVVLFGHGTSSIRWIPADAENRMDNTLLERAIERDAAEGNQPFLVVGTAGDVSTGAVDNLAGIAAVCKRHDVWFHVDGAYGIPAAVIPGKKALFDGITDADSIALDPHKWLYSPLEAGCVLVKDPQHLINTYSSHPVYYNFNGSGEVPMQNFYEYGFQNSRGFRALKVWMALQQVGRNGYIKLIGDDIALAEWLFKLANDHPELQGVTQQLSITTLRYVPTAIAGTAEEQQTYLNALNESLLNRLQKNGEVFLSNSVVKEKYCLRACIVNFRTTRKDIGEVIDIIVREGRSVDLELRSKQ